MNKTEESIEKVETMRHSLAHILAMAVLRLYPDSKLGIGPAIENGFYYEFQNDKQFVTKDLLAIEAEMHNIINENHEFKQLFVDREEAIDIIHQSGQIFKAELVKQIPDEQISFFKTGDFLDLCRGPHTKSTKDVGAFKLLRVEESYWLNQEYRPKLQKIVGVAFLTEEELNQFLNEVHQLKYKSALVLGKNLNYLLHDKSFGEKTIIWLSKGCIVKDQVKSFLSANLNYYNFNFVQTPSIGKYSFYFKYLNENKSEEKFLNQVKVGQDEYMLRTSSTPAHNLIFHSKKQSYKQLPVRLSEFVLNFENNENKLQYESLESHIYCINNQVVEELKQTITMTFDTLKKFGFKDITIEAKTPKKDDSEIYDQIKSSVSYAQQALNDLKLVAKISQKHFSSFGIELNFYVRDIFDKPHEISTIVLDLISGVKEKLNYIDKNNHPQNVCLIKFSLINSLDNFVSLLIENTEGYFPLWLSPIQVKILPISEKYLEQAKTVAQILKKESFRVDIDSSNNTIQSRIRDFEIEKIPYCLIIGDKEIKTNSISVRGRDGKELGLIRIEEFISKLYSEINIII